MATFPREKIFRLAASRLKAYQAISELERIPVNIHEITHEDQTYNYRYVVRVDTYNADTEESISRYVSLTDDKRFTKGELLGAARDLVMDSPVASNEEFQNADIVFALKKG